ncbi:MAG: deoxyuridine 5'-triphosphate nucleotidohydrolase [Chloroflexota bacterium]
MDTIELRGLTFYGYHGAFPEERRLGQRFVVDLRLGLDLAPAGQSDDLVKTVDYGRVAETVRSVVEGAPFQLIEALAEAVADSVLRQFSLVQTVAVRVEKPSAPVPTAPLGSIAVQIQRTRRPSPVGVAQIGAVAEPSADMQPSPGGSVLSAEAIRGLMRGEPPLLDPLADPAEQIQPNGVDLRLESVWRMDGLGAIGVANADRSIPERIAVEPSSVGWFHLEPGTYVIRFQEVVALPTDVMAFGRPRSSLLRCGAALHTAVWDAGYQGRSESLMVVYAPAGLRLEVGARVLQLVFVRLDTHTQPYAGAYQGENVPTPIEPSARY